MPFSFGLKDTTKYFGAVSPNPPGIPMRPLDRRVEKLGRSGDPTRNGPAGGHNANNGHQWKNRGVPLAFKKERTQKRNSENLWLHAEKAGG